MASCAKDHRDLRGMRSDSPGQGTCSTCPPGLAPEDLSESQSSRQERRAFNLGAAYKVEWSQETFRAGKAS